MKRSDFRSSLSEAQWGSIRAMYGTPDWLTETTVHEVTTMLPMLRRDALYRTAGFLGYLTRIGRLGKDTEHVIEFGSGSGEGIVALSALRTALGATVRVSAAELDPYGIGEYEASKGLGMMYFGKHADVTHDGLELLEQKTSSADLVVAHMFGPVRTPRDTKFLGRFISASTLALRPSGIVALYSDNETMNHVADAAHERARTLGIRVERVDPDELPSLLSHNPAMLWRRK